MNNDLESAKVESVLRQACAAIHSRWRQGEQCRCEEMLDSHPDLANSVEATLELIYAEFVAREDLGQEPTAEELYQRFPSLRDRIERLLGIHRVLANERAASSNGVSALETHASPGPRRFGQNVAEDREQVGQYTLIDEIARGGMGVVYRARQLGLDRIVALKMIRWRFPGEDELQRFRSEAEAAARLQHAHIVQIFEIGEDRGDAFIAMEYVEGGSLADRLGGDPLAPADAARWMEQLARATHFAHEEGIVHRDLKPSNVLISSSGEPKVTDFGLAKQLSKDSSLTRTGAALGTPSYMSPEQARGEVEIGPASDVYGLGATMYEMLTGRPPFVGTGAAETLEQVRNQTPLPPRQLQPGLPKDLETICLKALRKEPAKRYGSAALMADDIDRFLADQPIQARPVGALERAIKWVRREPRLALAICLLVLTTAVAFGIVNAQRIRAQKGWDKAAEEAGLKDLALKEQKIQTDRAEHRKYVLLMGTAERQWSMGNALKTREFLAECPEQLRGWEWHYLHRVSQPTDAMPLERIGYTLACNGNQAAVGLMSGQLKLIDTTTMAVTRTFEPPDVKLPFVSAVSFSRDGNKLAWAVTSQGMILPTPRLKKVDSVLNVLDLKSGKIETTKLPPVHGIVCHPQGEFVVTVGFDGKVVLHYLDSAKPAKVLRPAGTRITMSVCDISPSGRLLAVGQLQNIVVMDLQSEKETAKLTLDNRIFGLRFGPSERNLAAATEKTAEIWDVKLKRRSRRFAARNRQPVSLAYSPDGKLLVTGGDDNELKFWDVESSRPFDTLRGHVSSITGIDFLDGGKKLVSVAALLASPGTEKRGQLRIWDLQKQLVRDVRPRRQMFARSTDGRQAIRLDEKGVHLIDTIARQETAVFKIRKSDQFVLNHDGTRLAIRNGRTVEIYDLGNGERLSSCTFADDVTIPKRKKGTMLNIYANRPIAFIKAISLDGQRMLVVEAGGILKQLSTVTGQVEHQFEGRMMRTRLPIYSDDGTLLAAAVAPGKLAVWSSESGKLLHELEFWGGPFIIRFSPDGQRIAAAGSRSVMLWDVVSGRRLYEMGGHRSGIQGLAFSPDGTRLASSASAVKLWDLTTGNQFVELGSLTGYGAHRLGFSRDGRFLVAVSQDGIVRLWNGSKED